MENTYIFDFEINGHISIPVRADDPDAAEQLAIDAFESLNAAQIAANTEGRVYSVTGPDKRTTYYY